MKPTPLADVAEHPADAIIYCLVGTLKIVHERKTGTIGKGTNKGSPWAIQNLVITDGKTDVQVALKDREDEIPKSWKNREVMFEAHQGTKGWSGVYAFDDNYNDVITRKVKVTATGQISLVGEAPHSQAAEPPPAQQRQQPAQQQPSPEKPPATGHTTAHAVNKGDIADVVAKANQIANLQLLCLTTTANYTAARFKEKNGRELSTQEIHAMAISMCIELFRSASYTKMPTTQFETKPQP